MKDFNELVQRYSSAFKKARVNVETLKRLEKCRITETYEHYRGRVLLEREEKEITAENYALVISSIEFFDDKLTFAATIAGNIPVKLVSVSWGDGSEKAIRKYFIERKQEEK